MKIAFFISDHGYGHIMRNIPVIREVLERGHEAIIVCADRHLAIAQEYLETSQEYPGGVSVEYVGYHTDAGLVVKPGTLIVDKKRTAEAVRNYVAEFPERIAFAMDVFRRYDIQCVVADIVPWALQAAKEFHVSSFLMASFTWMEQYEGFVPENDLSVLRTAFQSAGHVLYYELVNRPTLSLLGNGTQVGFVARPFTHEVSVIRERYHRQIVFLSLGASNSGLDFDIDVSLLPYDFISTGVLRLIGENVTYLDASVPNTQDYVKAADFCIAKAGWSTVSEMMLAGVRFAVLKRPDVPEDTMIIEQLESREAAVGIDVWELQDMNAVMRKLETYAKTDHTYENGYRKVVDRIVW